MATMAWAVDGRGRQAPERQADAMSEQEFQDRIIEAVTIPSLHMFAGYAFPDVDQATGRLYHATFMKYFSFFAWKFPSWLMSIASRCPHMEVRREIIEDCVDEEVGDQEAGGRCHVDILYEEAEACGMSRAEIAAAKPSPTLLACIHALENLSNTLSWQASLAAVQGLEMLSTTPSAELRKKLLEAELSADQITRGRSSRDADALAERTGVPADQLVFASHHEYKDQFHGGSGLALMQKYGTSRSLQEEMLWAAGAGVEIFCVMREEIDRLARAAIGLPPGAQVRLKIQDA